MTRDRRRPSPVRARPTRDGDAEVHPPRAGGLRGPGSAARLRRAHRVERAGHLGLHGRLAYMTAESPADFEDRAHAPRGRAPSVNHVYADTTATSPGVAAGCAPVRPNWDGLLPVPGDGRYEWDGASAGRGAAARGRTRRAGFFATANEMNIAGGLSALANAKLGFEWAEHSRTRRIHEVLRAQPRHSLAQSMALQTDTLSLPARRLGALLGTLAVEDGGDAAFGLDLLLRLGPSARRAKAPLPRCTKCGGPSISSSACSIASPPTRKSARYSSPATWRRCSRCSSNPTSGCRTATPCCATRSPPPSPTAAHGWAASADWAWGRLHHGYFPHPLDRVAEAMPAVGPLPKGGSGSTPMAANYRLSDFRVISGASVQHGRRCRRLGHQRVHQRPGPIRRPRVTALRATLRRSGRLAITCRCCFRARRWMRPPNGSSACYRRDPPAEPRC